MGTEQCPHCGRLGQYRREGAPLEDILGPHDLRARHDGLGPPCRCRHVNANDRLHALKVGGRYWDGAAWVCPWCGTAPAPTEEEWTEVLLRMEESYE